MTRRWRGGGARLYDEVVQVDEERDELRLREGRDLRAGGGFRARLQGAASECGFRVRFQRCGFLMRARGGIVAVVGAVVSRRRTEQKRSSLAASRKASSAPSPSSAPNERRSALSARSQAWLPPPGRPASLGGVGSSRRQLSRRRRPQDQLVELCRKARDGSAAVSRGGFMTRFHDAGRRGTGLRRFHVAIGAAVAW